MTQQTLSFVDRPRTVAELGMASRLMQTLVANTGPDTVARRLGEWFLAHGPATTGEIVEFGSPWCSSILQRLYVDLRGRCGWPVKSKRIPGRKTFIYWLGGVMEEPRP